jgi:hypothetical protein
MIETTFRFDKQKVAARSARRKARINRYCLAVMLKGPARLG